MSEQTEIFAAIVNERKYQDHKRGTIEERNLSIEKYLYIARSELYEAIQAFIAGDDGNARCEALQAATVLVAMLEGHGVRERDIAAYAEVRS